PSSSGTAVALLLGHLAHTSTGWPLPRGGGSAIADALVADREAHGGLVRTGHRVEDLEDLPKARSILLDVAPKGFLALAGDRLPSGYRRALQRFRYASGAAKVDFLVSEPIPWSAPEVGLAGTVHLGGTQAQMFRAEKATARGRRAEEPFVLLVDPAVTDPDRAEPGRRPVWAYAHVPHGILRTRSNWCAGVSKPTLRVLVTPSSRPVGSPLQHWRSTTPTTSAVTSPPGRCHRARPFCVPPPGSTPTGHRCPACTCVRPRPHPAPGYTGCRVTWPRCPLCTAITGYAWGRPCPREGEGARATFTGCLFGLRSASCRIPLPTARVWGPPGRSGSTSRPRP